MRPAPSHFKTREPIIGAMPTPPPAQRKPTFLRAWRKHRGMTQDRAAEYIEIDRTTLGRIERGVLPFNQDQLEGLADLYNCTTADLLRTDPTKLPEPDFVDLYRAATPDIRKAAVRVLKDE